MEFLSAYPSIVVVLGIVLWLVAHPPPPGENRKRYDWTLVVASLVVPAGMASEALANSLSAIRPLKYDLYVDRFDAFFGQPSFLLGNWVAGHRALIWLVSLTYGLLPIVILGVFCLYLWKRADSETLQVLRTFVLNLVLAAPVYLLFPVCGPQFAFPHFPAWPQTFMLPHPIEIAAAPNGVPSVHMSSALLVLCFLCRWRWGAVAGTLFLALTVLATLGSGQHYLFDLIVAIPYTAIVWRLGKIEWALPRQARLRRLRRRGGELENMQKAN